MKEFIILINKGKQLIPVVTILGILLCLFSYFIFKGVSGLFNMTLESFVIIVLVLVIKKQIKDKLK